MLYGDMPGRSGRAPSNSCPSSHPAAGTGFILWPDPNQGDGEMRKDHITKLCTGMLAGGVLLFGAACDKTKDTGAVTSTTSTGTTTTPPAEVAETHGTAWVRVVNADPALKTAVVFAGDSTRFSGVAYKQATAFKELPD